MAVGVLGGPASLKSPNAGSGVMRNERETEDGARDWGDEAAIRSAAHWLPSHQTQAPVMKSITLNRNQVKGRERIGRLKILHRHPRLPAENGQPAT